MKIEEIQKAASAAYLNAVGPAEFVTRHERGIAAAVAAVAPLILSEPTKEEMAIAWNAVDISRSTGWTSMACIIFANRLASLTAKPDPAVEAVAGMLCALNEEDSYIFDIEAAKIVAAVDAARAK